MRITMNRFEKELSTSLRRGGSQIKLPELLILKSSQGLILNCNLVGSGVPPFLCIVILPMYRLPLGESITGP
jgi:hypothetical protein